MSRDRFDKIIAIAVNPGAYEEEAIAALLKARQLAKENPSLAPRDVPRRSFSWDLSPELARKWSAASHRRFSSVAVYPSIHRRLADAGNLGEGANGCEPSRPGRGPATRCEE
jgi:hypothetical protein